MADLANSAAIVQRAREVIQKLATAPDDLLNREDQVRFDAAPAVARSAWSWWNLISDSARIFLAEEAEGRGPVVAPIARNLLNHAVALEWLVKGGANAIRALDAYSDEKLLSFINQANESLRNVRVDFPDEPQLRRNVEQRDKDRDTAVTTLTNQITNVCALMAAAGKPRLYLWYRRLSSFSHTSRDTASMYVLSDDQRHTLLREPRQRDSNDVVWTAGLLIEAGRAIDSILTGQPLSQRLSWATNHLDLPPDTMSAQTRSQS
jgi:hypothetical protein